MNGVDFPRVALSEARWDGKSLHLAAHPQNASVVGTRTRVRVTNLDPAAQWSLIKADGNQVPLAHSKGTLEVELTVDNRSVKIQKA